MAITPNGRTVYAGYGTAIILIRAATNKAGKPIKLSWEADLMAMAITANGKTIYCLIATGASNQGLVIPVRIPAGTASTRSASACCPWPSRSRRNRRARPLQRPKDAPLRASRNRLLRPVPPRAVQVVGVQVCVTVTRAFRADHRTATAALGF